MQTITCAESHKVVVQLQTLRVVHAGADLSTHLIEVVVLGQKLSYDLFRLTPPACAPKFLVKKLRRVDSS